VATAFFGGTGWALGEAIGSCATLIFTDTAGPTGLARRRMAAGHDLHTDISAQLTDALHVWLPLLGRPMSGDLCFPRVATVYGCAASTARNANNINLHVIHHCLSGPLRIPVRVAICAARAQFKDHTPRKAGPSSTAKLSCGASDPS